MSGKLSARGVVTAKPGRHSDGGGLYLVVSPTGTKKWVYRFTFSGRVNETGVGGGDVPLAEAREKAVGLRNQVRDGLNPVAVKRQAKAKMLARVTFGQLADDFITNRAPSWRNPKSEGQWRTSLKTYAAGLANLPVDEIGTEHVLAALKPIWATKPETAKRVRNRLELILNAAIARGLRAGPNPALWRGHLDHLLSKPLQVEKSHHAAMPYDEVPAFMTALRHRETVATLALELMVLTASRSGEVLGARWAEINTKDRLNSLNEIAAKPVHSHFAIEAVSKARFIKAGTNDIQSLLQEFPLKSMVHEEAFKIWDLVNASVHLGYFWAKAETELEIKPLAVARKKASKKSKEASHRGAKTRQASQQEWRQKAHVMALRIREDGPFLSRKVMAERISCRLMQKFEISISEASVKAFLMEIEHSGELSPKKRNG